MPAPPAATSTAWVGPRQQIDFSTDSSSTGSQVVHNLVQPPLYLLHSQAYHHLIKLPADGVAPTTAATGWQRATRELPVGFLSPDGLLNRRRGIPPVAGPAGAA
jgi:hypothetical protein